MNAIKAPIAKLRVLGYQRLVKNWPLNAMVLGYVVFLSAVSLVRHFSFQSSAWDLGIFDQACFSTLSGRLFYYTAELYANPGGSIFGVHFSPILFVVIPFYAILQNPATLLVIQSAVVGAGAYPVFLISQHVLQNRKLSYYFALLYLVYPHIYGINIFDFHTDAFFVPLALFALYFFLKGDWKKYFVFVLLGLSTKEFMAIVFAAYGVGQLLTERHDVVEMIRFRKHPSKKVIVAAMTIIVSAFWFVMARLIIRVFNPAPPQGFAEGSPWSLLGFSPLDPASWLNAGQGSLQQAVGYDLQSKLFYMVTVFAPLGFLSLFRLTEALPALVWMTLAFLSNYPPYYQIGFQYSALVAPFVIVAAIRGFDRIRSLLKADSHRTGKLVRRLFLACVLVSLVLSLQGLPPNLQAILSTHDQKLNALIAQTRGNYPDASILTQYDLFPHVSTNLKSYVVPPMFPAFNKSYYAEYVQSLFDLKPDFVILDLNPDIRTDSLRSTYLYSFENLERLSGDYGLYASSDGIFVYRHKYSGEPIVNEPFVLTLKYDIHINVNVVLFSGVFPRGTYDVRYQMKLPALDTGPACIAELSQGNVVLVSQNLSAGNSHDTVAFQNYTMTMEITSSSTEVMFSILNPATSADISLKSIIVSLQELQR
jgi:uncharacterized membrane protein